MVAGTVNGRRYGVVLVTYGEVERPAIRKLLPSSRKIVHVVTRQIVTLPKALIYALADYRTVKHYLDWQFNRYRSRLVPINRVQTEGVKRELAASTRLAAAGIGVEVAEAYYFVPPYLETVLERFRSTLAGVVVVPMIPVESAFSCGVACQMVIDLHGEAHAGKVRVMHGLWKHEELYRIYLDHLFGSLLPEMHPAGDSKPGLVLVIHGTIVRGRDGNPPAVFTGLEETYAFYRIMRDRILSDPRNVFGEVKLGCLNHTAGGEWTPDTVQKALGELRDAGVDAVAMFPFGYFADNSETDYEAKKLLDASGIVRRQYIPCINESTDFFRWLGRLIEKEVVKLDRQRDFFCAEGDSEPNKESSS
ncbi:MAG: ferrochelatase [Chlorobiaceae bacterium]|nr:ferrochelatase [Chlorobiaceae bacterium]NTV25315.1 ferrochelatase [Chlorobiaceae bacterium]